MVILGGGVLNRCVGAQVRRCRAGVRSTRTEQQQQQQHHPHTLRMSEGTARAQDAAIGLSGLPSAGCSAATGGADIAAGVRCSGAD